MFNPFNKKQTLKILFVNPSSVRIEPLSKSIKRLPIIIAADFSTDRSYLLETHIEVRK